METPVLQFTASPGNSVLFPGLESEPHGGVIQWEFTDPYSKQKSFSIIDYYILSPEPEIYSNYAGRVKLYKNASLLLLSINKNDGGIYGFLVNLTLFRHINLSVIDQLSFPSIVRNLTSFNKSIALSCSAKEEVTSYIWQKNGEELPTSAVLLSSNQIIITMPEKYVCERYRCIVKNQLSENSAEYHLHPQGPHQFPIVLAYLAMAISLLSMFACICHSEGWRRMISEITSILLALTATGFWALTGENPIFTVSVFINLFLILAGNMYALAKRIRKRGQRQSDRDTVQSRTDKTCHISSMLVYVLVSITLAFLFTATSILILVSFFRRKSDSQQNESQNKEYTKVS
ncbi:uncharacterized protein LOC122795581 isoform X2 [Protopterus annectens]|uniref:uncharacterized protein LOC122795581 isoform X2 n=1 Tax=Protopterus annectens TaxID=7888 RepID=UPI001CFC068D|nr:uncharacterized protein LOC122795581 isoform X2 [Protopterus annectens]